VVLAPGEVVGTHGCKLNRAVSQAWETAFLVAPFAPGGTEFVPEMNSIRNESLDDNRSLLGSLNNVAFQADTLHCRSSCAT
jgi:hypothetical protein